MPIFIRFWAFSPLLLLVCECMAAPPSKIPYKILLEAPHDSQFYTQGLIVDGPTIVESSGGYGRSRIRKYYVQSNHTQVEALLPKDIFAEGLTRLNNSYFVLSWRRGKLFELSTKTLAIQRTLNYPGEGWGLTHNGQNLIMSDGSHQLFFRDPQEFKLQGSISVTSEGKSWRRLNELEYAQGWIWANIWQDTRILKIDPATGKVLGFADFSPLVKQYGDTYNKVLNGIAYDARRKAYWITGKLWSKRFLVSFNNTGPSENKAKP